MKISNFKTVLFCPFSTCITRSHYVLPIGTTLVFVLQLDFTEGWNLHPYKHRLESFIFHLLIKNH